MYKLAESHAQQDSSFLTEVTFTRLTAEKALRQLRKQGFSDEQLPAAGTMAKILNRLGFRLRPVVEFVDHIGLPVQLLYYPPYHSKYNSIERCWGILEMHWNGAKLVDTKTMLAWAKTVTWKGLYSIKSYRTTSCWRGKQ